MTDAGKLIPRNLTARAGRAILGNPANSRPESAVDNCFPGLEFDTRSLERGFFPGLRFEFFQPTGATIVAVKDPELGLRDEDFRLGQFIHLWGIRASIDNEPCAYHDCTGIYGLEIWRKIRALSSGPLALIAGPGKVCDAGEEDEEELLASLAPSESRAVRDDAGRLRYFVAAGERASCLDGNGVIDLAVHEPGELTQTMCAPWMYDFRDCFCFYWASNKPDIVDYRDGSNETDYPVNFLRADRKTDPPPVDQISWNGRREGELTNRDLAEGSWERLPVILGDRESDSGVSSTPPALAPILLTRETLVAHLSHLATIEHALMIEYLFAMYSVNEDVAAPLVRQNLLAIAIDEMRHFLWVNRLLDLLGAKPSLGRAKIIIECPDPDPVTGEVGRDHPFSLRRLDRATLQDLIDVERPSRSVGSGADGLYVQILGGLNHGIEGVDNAAQLTPLVKLLIDEGHDHYRRLVGVRAALRGLDEEDYLYQMGPPSTVAQKAYLGLCDSAYRAVLDAIRLSFTLSGEAREELLRGAIRSMHNLDETACRLVREGVAPRFRMPR